MGRQAVKNSSPASEVKERWEKENSETIEREKAENEDEEDLVAELRQVAMGDELDIIQEACIGLLKINLKNILDKPHRRLRAEKRLEELGFPKMDKPNQEQKPDEV